ncbi:MAG: hypothetical protein ACRC2T_18845 [Thermoguttaceae bacterium]
MPFGLFAPKVGHQALYNELCKVHDLDKKTKALLDQIVQAFDLKQPSLVFVDMTYFQKALANPAFASQGDTIREICFKWFGRRI